VVITDEEPEPGCLDKPVEMFHIAEHFCLGQRRLHVFGRDSSIRPGNLGKILKSSQLLCVTDLFVGTSRYRTVLTYVKEL